MPAVLKNALDFLAHEARRQARIRNLGVGIRNLGVGHALRGHRRRAATPPAATEAAPGMKDVTI